MSRAEWARHRQGYMKHNPMDYTNYKKTYSPEQDSIFRFKQK